MLILRKPRNTKDILENIITVNPMFGCTIGCPYCYACRLNTRFKLTPDFKVPTKMPQALKRIHTRTPKSIFMDSMSDLAMFPKDWRDEVFEEMRKYPNNYYLFLTKLPNKVEGLDCRDMKNVWIGVTITSSSDLWRIKSMKQNIKAANYCLCIEPLHGDLGKIDLTGIDHIVIGAETGNRSGKIIPKKEWVDNIVEQADKAKVPILMKDSLLPIVGDSGFRQDNIKFFRT